MPAAGTCQTAASPAINISGPSSGQALFNSTVVFSTLGNFAVVNPTFCREEPTFETVACSAKVFINVVVPAETPAPGSTIIVVGRGGTQNVFPSPLVVDPGADIWFRFDILAGVTETDTAGVPITGGLSCPVATSIGSFCRWMVNETRTYHYRATPFSFGGQIDVSPPIVAPVGAFVIDVGLAGNSFSVPVGTIPVGSSVYFRFVNYGPYRVQRADGNNCQPFVGPGSFDSRYAAAGRVFEVGIQTLGGTWFFDPNFCRSDGMLGVLQTTGGADGSEFVEVIVAPRNNITGVTDLSYAPNPAIVFQGGSVRWTFTDVGHTVTQTLDNSLTSCETQPGGFNSGFVQPPLNGIGGTFVRQFDEIGTFNYHCAAHCNQGMRASVQVVPRPENIITHGVNNQTNPNVFSPPILVSFTNDTVCWDFVTAGDIVEGEFFEDCIAKPGGFNSGFQQVGARICRNFTGPSCTAFYYFDTQQCVNGMSGVVILSDRPVVQVRNGPQIYMPQNLNVTVGATVMWSFDAAGNSVTQAVSANQFGNADQQTRCAVAPFGFDSGVNQNAGTTFTQTFTQVELVPYFSTPFCPFPAVFPDFFGTVNVCNPIERRPTIAPTDEPTVTPSPTPTPDPCNEVSSSCTTASLFVLFCSLLRLSFLT